MMGLQAKLDPMVNVTMGKLQVQLEGNFEDMSRIYEFMKLHTKSASKATWLSKPDDALVSAVSFSVTI